MSATNPANILPVSEIRKSAPCTSVVDCSVGGMIPACDVLGRLVRIGQGTTDVNHEQITRGGDDVQATDVCSARCAVGSTQL